MTRSFITYARLSYNHKPLVPFIKLQIFLRTSNGFLLFRIVSLGNVGFRVRYFFLYRTMYILG